MASENKPLDLDLSEFCKAIMKEMSDITDNKCTQEAEALYEQKCFKLLKDIDKTNAYLLSESLKCQCLQTIAQFVLELTYIDECKLVEEEFPPEDATTYSRVLFIIDSLGKVDKLAQELLPNKSILESLGPDILECLHWRKGALLYMYCHTLNSKQDPSSFPGHYQKCLENGVDHLKCLLCTRTKPKWIEQLDGDYSDEDYEDDQTFLFAKGLYSDTHLLALMYCGELCYWLIQHITRTVQSSVQVTEAPSSIDSCSTEVNTPHDKTHLNMESKTNWNLFRQTGQACLTVYIKSANGPLSPGGWSTKRAEEIINYLKCH